MKIITVNLPVSYLKTIDGLIGEKAFYPSRSELVRVALKEFLIRELEATHLMLNTISDKPNLKIEKMNPVETTTSQPIQTPMMIKDEFKPKPMIPITIPPPKIQPKPLHPSSNQPNRQATYEERLAKAKELLKTIGINKTRQELIRLFGNANGFSYDVLSELDYKERQKRFKKAIPIDTAHFDESKQVPEIEDTIENFEKMYQLKKQIPNSVVESHQTEPNKKPTIEMVKMQLFSQNPHKQPFDKPNVKNWRRFDVSAFTMKAMEQVNK